MVIEYTKTMSKRNRQIFALRVAGLTYQKIGDSFNLSKDRVRQICEKTEAGIRRMNRPLERAHYRKEAREYLEAALESLVP